MATPSTANASKPAKAKRNAKNRAEKRAESPATPVSAIPNPYLAVVYKKLRSLRKKAERIRALEQELHAGTHKLADLNQEQVALYNSKPSVERAIMDIEALKAQLEEVAANEATSRPSTDVVEETQQQPEATSEPEPAKEVADAPEAVHEQTQVGGGAEHDVEATLTQLLKLVHVATRSSVLATGAVPIEVNFLVQSILGHTLLPHVSFDDGLMQAVQQARAYLEGSELVVAQDKSFRELAAQVEALVNPPAPATEEEPAAGKEEEEEVQAEPEFNFFAHEQPHDDNEIASHAAFNGAASSAWVGMPSNPQSFDGASATVESAAADAGATTNAADGEGAQNGKEERAGGRRQGQRRERNRGPRQGRGNKDGKEHKEHGEAKEGKEGNKGGKEHSENKEGREGKPARRDRERKHAEGGRPPREGAGRGGEHKEHKEQHGGRPHKPRNPRPQGDKAKGQQGAAAAAPAPAKKSQAAAQA